MAGNERGALRIYSLVLLSFYFAVEYLEKINALLIPVLILDGVLTLAGGIFIVMHYRRKPFRFSHRSTLLLLATFFMLFSALAGGSDMERAAVLLFALVQSWAVALATGDSGKDGIKLFSAVAVFILVFSLVYCAVSLRMGFDEGDVRFDGLSRQSNTLAVIAATSLLLSLSMAGRRGSAALTVVWNIFIALVSVFFLYVLGKTDSRTSFFALIVAATAMMLLFLVFSRKKSILFILVPATLAVIAVAVFFLLSSMRSRDVFDFDVFTSNRSVIWRDIISSMGLREWAIGFSGNTERMIQVMKEAGAGRSVIEQAAEKHLAHSMYIQILCEYGIVPALSFFAIWFSSIFHGLSYLSSSGGSGRRFRLVLFSVTMLVFFLIHSLAESSIYFIGGAEQMLFIFSLSAVHSAGGRKKEGKDG